MPTSMRRRGDPNPQTPSPAGGKGPKVPRLPRKGKKGKESSPFPPGIVVCGVAVATVALAAFSLYLLLPNGRDGPLKKDAGHLSPFPGPKVIDLPMFQGHYKEQMLWGTYRPHLYLGVRARLPKSLVAGVMWIAPKADAFEVRHTCQQHDKVLKTYGWLRHDGRTYGRQAIQDGHFDITTFFAKSVGEEGSGFGGDWSVRFAAKSSSLKAAKAEGTTESPEEKEEPKAISFFFYIGDEGGKPINVMPQWREAAEPDRVSEVNAGVLAAGESKPFGKWELHYRLQRTGHKHVAWEGMKVRHFHNLSEGVRVSLARGYQLQQALYLPRASEDDASLAIIQVTLYPPAEAEFIFVSSSPESYDPVNVAARVERLSGAALDTHITASEAAFDKRFAATFPAPDDGGQSVGTEDVEVGKAALSNMLGGMGYFFGQSRIAIPEDAKRTDPRAYWHYWPAPLFTAVPSRSFFPRGFLWDEGFHQLIISKWDAMLSMDAMGHWLDLVNANGWIPREQILGEEARSFVPEEFVQQHLDNGNPPTLFLPLSALAAQAHVGAASTPGEDAPPGTVAPEVVAAFLERALPRLQRWFHWFNTTQGGLLHGSYYWHGRDAHTNRELNPKTLQSGLDDYPRASHPGPQERHLDLRCWLALASTLLCSIRRALGDKDGNDKLYLHTAEMLNDADLLHTLHWDSETESFADFGNHTQAVKLVKREVIDQESGVYRTFYERSVGSDPAPSFVPQFGYVSLFPLLLKLLPPDSPSLGRTLQQLGEQSLLWTPQGLRSLSINSTVYMKRNTEHDPPYWRGPIWININYLAVSALHHYSRIEGPFQGTARSLYHGLRKNLIKNLVKQYKRSGYLWEQYDATSGKGKGSHPFTGWTALLVLMMSGQYH